MFHKTHRFSILALVLTGLLIPTTQALAGDPPLPVTGPTFRCTFLFTDGLTGEFNMKYLNSWSPRQIPPPNKLWAGQLQNESNPPLGVDLAWKPNELENLELTIRSQQKQCKSFQVRKVDLPFGCWETNRAEQCEGGGLENLVYQRCRVYYQGPCG